MSDLINEQIYQCDGCDLTHKWEDNGGYVCEGTTKYHALQLYYNTGGGWEAATPTITKPGSVIEEKSMDCGYPEPRLRATLAYGKIKDVKFTCTQGDDTCRLSGDEIFDTGIPISQIKNADFYGGNQIYTSIGDFIFAGCQTLSAVTFHGRYEHIGDYCFYSSGVRSISGTVQSFGDFSFANCKNLTSVTNTYTTTSGATGVATFANCTSLTSIDLSKFIGLGSSTFLGCTNLRTAKIPASVPPSCFEACTNLYNVEINTDNSQGYGIGARAFLNCTNLTSITTTTRVHTLSFDDFAFAGCEKLSQSEIENVLFGDSSGDVEYSIASGAFMGCKLLTHIPKPLTGNTSITSVGACGFSGCTGLQSAEFGDGIEYIGDSSFAGCIGLRSINLGENITSIGSHAFDGCTGITGITIDNDTPPTLEEGAFDNSNFTIYVPCNHIIDYVNSSYVWESYKSRISGIPPCNQPVYTLRARATYADGRVVTNYCDGVSTGVSKQMFNYSSSAITNIEFGECVTSVAYAGFSDCALTSVNIPSGVTSIGDYAFARCTGLMSVTVNSVAPPQLGGGSGTQTFFGTPIALSTGVIYVPASAVETYKSATGWSSYASRIYAIPGS